MASACSCLLYTSEREAKAEELQQILDERQEKADGITAQVAKQIDVLIESVHEKMAEIEMCIRDRF